MNDRSRITRPDLGPIDSVPVGPGLLDAFEDIESVWRTIQPAAVWGERLVITTTPPAPGECLYLKILNSAANPPLEADCSELATGPVEPVSTP